MIAALLRALLCAALALPLVAFAQDAGGNEEVPTDDELVVRVALRYNVGGAQPVAHTRFFLLDRNPNTVVAEHVGEDRARAAEVTGTDARPGRIAPRGVVEAAPASPMRRYLAACAVRVRACVEARDELLRASVASAETNLDGVAAFEGLAPGTYYVYGRAATRGGGAIYWSERVEVPRSLRDGALELSDANAIGVVD